MTFMRYNFRTNFFMPIPEKSDEQILDPKMTH